MLCFTFVLWLLQSKIRQEVFSFSYHSDISISCQPEHGKLVVDCSGARGQYGVKVRRICLHTAHLVTCTSIFGVCYAFWVEMTTPLCESQRRVLWITPVLRLDGATYLSLPLKLRYTFASQNYEHPGSEYRIVFQATLCNTLFPKKRWSVFRNGSR